MMAYTLRFVACDGYLDAQSDVLYAVAYELTVKQHCKVPVTVVLGNLGQQQNGWTNLRTNANRSTNTYFTEEGEDVSDQKPWTQSSNTYGSVLGQECRWKNIDLLDDSEGEEEWYYPQLWEEANFS